VNYLVFNERFLQEKAEEKTIYQLFSDGLKEAAGTVTSELVRQYRKYASVFNPLQEVA
jgi:hypothetical protein